MEIKTLEFRVFRDRTITFQRNHQMLEIKFSGSKTMPKNRKKNIDFGMN